MLPQQPRPGRAYQGLAPSNVVTATLNAGVAEIDSGPQGCETSQGTVTFPDARTATSRTMHPPALDYVTLTFLLLPVKWRCGPATPCTGSGKSESACMLLSSTHPSDNMKLRLLQRMSARGTETTLQESIAMAGDVC